MQRKSDSSKKASFFDDWRYFWIYFINLFYRNTQLALINYYCAVIDFAVKSKILQILYCILFGYLDMRPIINLFGLSFALLILKYSAGKCF